MPIYAVDEGTEKRRREEGRHLDRGEVKMRSDWSPVGVEACSRRIGSRWHKRSYL